MSLLYIKSLAVLFTFVPYDMFTPKVGGVTPVVCFVLAGKDSEDSGD